MESVTVGVTDNSFTRNLIEEMKRLSGTKFNVTFLYTCLMKRRGCRKLHHTPIHASLSLKTMKPSIVLTACTPPPRHEYSDAESSAIKDGCASILATVKPTGPIFTEQRHNAGIRVNICARLKASESLPSPKDWLSYLVEGAPEEIEAMAITLERDVPENSSCPFTPTSDSHESNTVRPFLTTQSWASWFAKIRSKWQMRT